MCSLDLDSYILCSNVSKLDKNTELWTTLITMTGGGGRADYSGAVSRHMFREQPPPRVSEGRWRVIQWRAWSRRGDWRCWGSTCMPKLSQIIRLYQKNAAHSTSSSDLTCQTSISWLLSAADCNGAVSCPFDYYPEVTLCGAACGVLGVNRAKTSEESPLMDNKKIADWLQTTQRGKRALHMNIIAILTGNFPERERERE